MTLFKPIAGPARSAASVTPGADPHRAPEHTAEFRFYAELNDFLPAALRQRSFVHRYTGAPSLKDAIEALGVPHTEVDLVLVDGSSAAFDEPLRDGCRVAVFPMFETLDIGRLTRVRPAPLRVTRFVADVHLGTLARYLRLLGFDTLWRNDLDDPTIVAVAVQQRRIVLTRDRGILRNGRVTHGYWLRASEPLEQLAEVVRALDLESQARPYSRCMECNGELEAIGRDEAASLVPPRVLAAHAELVRCTGCGRVYWSGSHRARLDDIVARALNPSGRTE